MALLGHLIQVAHILLVVAVYYAAGRYSNRLIVVFTIATVIANIMCGLECPITIASNEFLREAGESSYPDVVSWFQGITGIPYLLSALLTLSCIPIAYATGRYMSNRWSPMEGTH